MAQITLKNAAGKDAGNVDLDDAVFGIQPNVPVMHQVVTAQLAARRAGTQSTKTRSEVRGGGAKPYRQKGTGNARQGSIRSPHYSGGGVALGPKPRKLRPEDAEEDDQARRCARRCPTAPTRARSSSSTRWGFDRPEAPRPPRPRSPLSASTVGRSSSSTADDAARRPQLPQPPRGAADRRRRAQRLRRALQRLDRVRAGARCRSPTVRSRPSPTPMATPSRCPTSSPRTVRRTAPASHAPLEDALESRPASPIKGNADSMLVHVRRVVALRAHDRRGAVRRCRGRPRATPASSRPARRRPRPQLPPTSPKPTLRFETGTVSRCRDR